MINGRRCIRKHCTMRKPFFILIALFLCLIILLQTNKPLIHKYVRSCDGCLLRLTRTLDSFIQNEGAMKTCPLVPPGLVGRLKVNKSVPAWSDVESEIDNVQPGGRFKPFNCTARDRIAVIIPYRDRDAHLRVFLRHIHPFLQKQLHNYQIYVVEQDSNGLFNTGMMKNIGFTVASQQYHHNCFIFNDVDYVPEDDRNTYSCSNVPHHLAVLTDKNNYTMYYNAFLGGVMALTKDQFENINGFSNTFFGWGSDDDDLYVRIKSSKMTISRYLTDVTRYKTLKHVPDKPNPLRPALMKTSQQRKETDGLNSLRYKLLNIEYRKLYTRILVYVNETEVLKNESIHKSALNETEMPDWWKI